MVVGEAPGAVEEREGKPFVGPAGYLLESMMRSAGIDPDEVWFTNLTGYRPPDNNLAAWFSPQGLPQDPRLIEGLFDLQEQIQHIRPNVIVPLGNFPLKLLTGKGNWSKKERTWTGIGNYRGSVLETRQIVAGIKTVPTYHPAAILRQYPLNAIARFDLQRAKEQSQFPEIRRQPKQIIIDPRGADQVIARERLLTHGDILTFDIEYIHNKLLCCGMTTHRDEAYVFVIKSGTDVQFIKELLLSGKPLNAQNGIFDCAILEWHYQIPCLPYLHHDTMIAAYNLAIEWPKDQGFLTSLYTDQPYYKDMISWDRVKAGTQPISDVWEYNGIDVWTEHQVMEEQRKELAQDPDIRKSFDFDMSKLAPLWDISKRGVLVDIAAMAEIKQKAEYEHTTADLEIATMVGHLVNVKSGPQVASFLFDELGIPSGPLTPGGQRKVSDGVLADLLLRPNLNNKQRNAIHQVRRSRENRDLVSKFCEIELDTDGRMRCHYDPAKTDTGRLSSKKFFPTGKGTNLQNQNKKAEIRKVYIADPGFEFAYADLERAESMVVAEISGDSEMIRIHQPGIDAHIATGAFLFSKPMDDITSEERYLAKRVRHASNYMMGWKRLMDTINADAQETGISITAAEAKVLVQGYRNLHPMLVQWWRDVEAELRSTRTLKTLTGRKRVFYDRLDAILPNAIAFIPQGTVGDVLNIGLVRCAHDYQLRQWDFQMLLQVHDAIGYQYRPEYRDQVHERVTDLMSVPLHVRKREVTFTIPVEIQYGPSWGELTKWRRPVHA